MKKTLILILLVLSGIGLHAADEIVLKGVYQGKNIYVMNPFASSGVGFCVFEVTVNGQMSTDEINSSAFEVDLTVYQFKKGDEVSIIIKYKDGCVPKIINPEVLKPQSTFEALNMKVDNNNLMTWTATQESGSLPFVVEQFRWNKWVKVAEIEGKGTPGSNNYSVKVPAHSGNNRFRIKQVDYTRKPRYSKEVRYRSLEAPVTFTPAKPENEIVFSRETFYEIYDYFGNLVDKGIATKVDISKLAKGDYFLNYDVNTVTFSKKK